MKSYIPAFIGLPSYSYISAMARADKSVSKTQRHFLQDKNIVLQIIRLSGSQGVRVHLSNRHSCEEPIPQGKALPPPDLVPITEDSPFPLLFVTTVCGNKGKIGSLYKTRQTAGGGSQKWDAHSPQAASSHAPSRDSDQTPNPPLGRTPHIGSSVSQNTEQAGVTKGGQASRVQEHLHLYPSSSWWEMGEDKTWGRHERGFNSVPSTELLSLESRRGKKRFKPTDVKKGSL